MGQKFHNGGHRKIAHKSHHAKLPLYHNNKHTGRYHHVKIGARHKSTSGSFSYKTGPSHVETLKGDDVHSGITDASYTVEICEAKKNVDYTAGKNLYVEVNSGRMITACGSQNVQTVTTVGSTSEWFVNSTPAINHFGTANIAVSLYNSNYAQYIVGGAQYPDQGKKVATDKFHLSSCNIKISMVNFDSVPVSSWLYVLECKTSTNFSPSDLWTRDLSLANVTGAYPPAANPGPGFGTIAVPGIDAPGVVNETPGACPNFSKIWKIKKVHRMNLAAAAQEDVDFHIKMHQTGDVSKFVAQNPAFTVDPNTWVAANIAVQYIRGSVVVMHVGRAGVVRDVSIPEGGSEPADAVTYGPVNVGIVVTKTYHMYPMKASANRFDSKVVFPQIPFGTSIDNTRILNVVDVGEKVKSA